MANSTFSIDVTILTSDKLRRIQFKLSKAFVKDTDDIDKDNNKDEVRVNWTIEFGLDERKKDTDKFDDSAVIKLKIDISKELEPKADKTLKEGLDNPQTAAAISAADSFKLWKKNKISEKSFRNSLTRIISRRDS